MNKLSPDEQARYSRHILMDEVGEAGQVKLKNASILVIGAGGLGCPALNYLAAAGVGRIGIMDHDTVESSNLQRQTLFSTSQLGQNKALAARVRLNDLNPLIEIVAYPEALTTQNALELFEDYDLIIDGTDNFSTRYLINDAAVLTNKAYVYGSIFKFEGQVSVFNYRFNDKEGPTYRCLFPEPPAAGSVPNCAEIGVLGVLPGLIGTQQANEALKILLGIGEPLSGKLLMINALDSSFHTISLKRDPQQVQKVLDNRKGFQTMDYDLFCGLKEDNREITVSELQQMMEAGPVQLIDVRETGESPVPDFEYKQIPLSELENRQKEIDPQIPTVLFCQRGNRSKKALEWVPFAQSLKGGVLGWFENVNKMQES